MRCYPASPVGLHPAARTLDGTSMTRETATNPPLPDTETARTIAASPERFELWDEAERVAADEQRPDDVTATYLHVLAQPLPPDVALELCERAAAFFSEWSEDGAVVVGVLLRALEIDPNAAWAFRRLTMLLTIERRWDELLEQYDRVLAATEDPARKIELWRRTNSTTASTSPSSTATVRSKTMVTAKVESIISR